VTERLRDESGGIDLLVDTVGGPQLPELLPAMSPGGRVVLVGYTAGRSVTLDLPTLMDLDVSLLPLNLFRLPARTQTAAATVLGLIQDGDLDLPMTRFGLDELASAVESLARGQTVGRVVVLPTPGRLSVPVADGGGYDQTAA
jgi:NADPH2:quinone reductase